MWQLLDKPRRRRQSCCDSQEEELLIKSGGDKNVEALKKPTTGPLCKQQHIRKASPLIVVKTKPELDVKCCVPK